MKVLLIDSDGAFPNLALMKISTYHKKNGDLVHFGSCLDPDVVYISCIYTWNREKAIQSSLFYPNAEIHFGGTGFNSFNTLPEEVEHVKPDYVLYDVDYSIGFTSRGCIRNCPWCVVPKKEGSIREHSPLEEFIEPKFNKIMLLDGNFLASPKRDEKLEQLISLRQKVCFSQGLDIRLITETNADLLSKIKYYDLRFKNRRLYFAWDVPSIESSVINGINLLLNAGIKRHHLMFYVLVGFYTNYQQDIHRVKRLIEFGVKPYVMLYNNIKGTYHHHLKRWVERRYYEIIPWEKYDHGDSQLHIVHEMNAPLEIMERDEKCD